MRDLEQEIRSFIEDNFMLAEGGAGLSGSDSLTQSGLVDSVGILELILFLESRFGVRIRDEEVTPVNMDTVERIVRFLEERLAAAEVSR